MYSIRTAAALQINVSILWSRSFRRVRERSAGGPPRVFSSAAVCWVCVETRSTDRPAESVCVSVSVCLLIDPPWLSRSHRWINSWRWVTSSVSTLGTRTLRGSGAFFSAAQRVFCGGMSVWTEQLCDLWPPAHTHTHTHTHTRSVSHRTRRRKSPDSLSNSEVEMDSSHSRLDGFMSHVLLLRIDGWIHLFKPHRS